MGHRHGYKNNQHCDDERCKAYKRGYNTGHDVGSNSMRTQEVIDEIRHLRAYVRWLEEDRAKIEAHRQRLLRVDG